MKIKKHDLVITSVCIALLSAPLYLFRFSFFGLPLNLFLVFCFASFLILIFQTSINDFWQFVKKNQLFIFFTFLILLGGFLSLCHNGLCAKSLSIFLQWLLLPSLFSILVAIQLKKKPSHVETVLFVLFLSISLVSVIALGFALSNIFYLVDIFNQANILNLANNVDCINNRQLIQRYIIIYLCTI